MVICILDGQTKEINFNTLSPDSNYNNPNDNSLVLYANIFNTNYLFTGDISVKIEERINLNKLEVDVLKLAHHGSNTSTSIKFLNELKINEEHKIVICMNGYKNQFSFPTDKTVKKIKTNLYITSITKTVCIRKNIFNNKLVIKLL
jgi:competence protein ComEC